MLLPSFVPTKELPPNLHHHVAHAPPPALQLTEQAQPSTAATQPAPIKYLGLDLPVANNVASLTDAAPKPSLLSPFVYDPEFRMSKSKKTKLRKKLAKAKAKAKAAAEADRNHKPEDLLRAAYITKYLPSSNSDNDTPPRKSLTLAQMAAAQEATMRLYHAMGPPSTPPMSPPAQFIVPPHIIPFGLQKFDCETLPRDEPRWLGPSLRLRPRPSATPTTTSQYTPTAVGSPEYAAQLLKYDQALVEYLRKQMRGLEVKKKEEGMEEPF